MALPVTTGLITAKLTPQEMADFLDCLREQPNISRAARLTGRSRQLFYVAKQESEEFAKDWEEAIQEGVEHLEEAAWARAEDHSDLLTIFLLKANKPEKYRERLDVTSGGEPLATPVTMVEVIVPPSREEVEREASRIVALQAGKSED